MVNAQSLNHFGLQRLWQGAMTASSAIVVAVIDDDPSVLEALTNLLNSAGYLVAPFDSAESFLAGCAAGECACLISDIGLPGMNGIELQVAVGIREPNLPVILITGRDDYRFRPVDEFNNRGLFHKPFDAEKLLLSLAGAIKSSMR
jgi:FixJ family two-component response regulator